jgi:hypothetical protein
LWPPRGCFSGFACSTPLPICYKVTKLGCQLSKLDCDWECHLYYGFQCYLTPPEPSFSQTLSFSLKMWSVLPVTVPCCHAAYQPVPESSCWGWEGMAVWLAVQNLPRVYHKPWGRKEM